MGEYLSAYEDGTECSETSAYKIQTPSNYPEESIQHSEHGENLKSRNCHYDTNCQARAQIQIQFNIQQVHGLFCYNMIVAPLNNDILFF